MFEIFGHHVSVAFSSEGEADEDQLRPLIELYAPKKQQHLQKIELPAEFLGGTTLKEMREKCGLELEQLASKTKMRREWIEFFEADRFEKVAEFTSVSYCEFYLNTLIKEYSANIVFQQDARRYALLRQSLSLFLRSRLTPEPVDYRRLRKHHGRVYFTRAAI